MATEIYLGNPSQCVINWLKSHSTPVTREKTLITFTDGTSQEYDWEGEINRQTMIDAGLSYDGEYSWVKEPQTIEIGIKVTSIGDETFWNCFRLMSIIIPDSVTYIGYGVFVNCNSLTSIVIPDGVMYIESSAFEGCSGLTSITMPDSVTIIEGVAFAYCSGLTSVTIPNSVTSIGYSAFEGCSGLTSIVFKGKTLAEVQDMAYYPWGIDQSIISVEP